MQSVSDWLRRLRGNRWGGGAGLKGVREPGALEARLAGEWGSGGSRVRAEEPLAPRTPASFPMETATIGNSDTAY